MEVFGIVKEFSRLSQLVFPELSQKDLDCFRAWDRGDVENAIPGTGQVSALIRDVKSVKEIIEEMVS
ncbi:MAG: hypothetical protein JXA50_00990 [Deltaproteobacteria bacterium]|nr:hypothetical protein [Deltaproteobacteria bacterium]